MSTAPRILVVDDTPANAKLLVDLLGVKGYQALSASSGEQALAVALSTRLLDDRLHLEGAVGTQRLTGGNGQDFQVQDVRVSYDLKPGGAFQVTGYTQMNPVIPGQEGTSTQGVGIRFRKEFAYLREIFRQRKPSPTGEEDPLPTP